MKKISLLLCAALLLGLLSGCATESSPYVPTGSALDDGSTTGVTQPPEYQDQQLAMAYYPDKSLNPYTATDFTNRALLSLLYQGLFAVDENGTAVPILCKNYRVSPDMKTYTFSLCQAWFSDGTPVTVQDVAASYAAAQKGTYYAGRFQHITSVTATSDTVVIELDTAYQNLPVLLDIPIVKASQVDAASPLGTGPYMMDAEGKALRTQTVWWCTANAPITASEIPLVAADSPSDIRDQFEFSNIGLVCADPGLDTYAEYRCDYEVWSCETGMMVYLVCNDRSTLFANDALRQALTHAIDRSALAETFYRGFATPAVLPASPASPYYSTTLARRYGYDPSIFTAALEEIELSEDFQGTLVVSTNDSLRIRLAQHIAQTLTDLGVPMKVREVSPEELEEVLRWGSYDLYLSQTKLSPNMDLTAFFKEGGALSLGGLADSTIYTMNLEALANNGNYFSLHEMVLEDAHLCPLLFRSYSVYGQRGLLTNIHPARDNIFFYSDGRTLEDALGYAP